MLLFDNICIFTFLPGQFYFSALSKNSGYYGDFDIFCLIVEHREVTNFCKTNFETEMYDLRLCHMPYLRSSGKIIFAWTTGPPGPCGSPAP